MATSKNTFNWEDPFHLSAQLTEDERQVQEAARAYCQEKLLPRVKDAFLNETTDVAIFREMGELGLLGPTIPEQYGGAGLNYVCYGLVAREVERVDSGYRSMMSVQSSLVMVPINEFGTEAQKQKYLPKLARGEWIGCFGLTEPDHGSDPGSMATRAHKVPGGYKLSGSKMWISLADVADNFLIFAYTDKSKGHKGISCFIVERGAGDRGDVAREAFEVRHKARAGTAAAGTSGPPASTPSSEVQPKRFISARMSPSALGMALTSCAVAAWSVCGR